MGWLLNRDIKKKSTEDLAKEGMGLMQKTEAGNSSFWEIERLIDILREIEKRGFSDPVPEIDEIKR